MDKFSVGDRVYTTSRLDPPRVGTVSRITPTGRVNVEFKNRCGSKYTVQFSKDGVHSRGYSQTFIQVLTPDIEEGIKQLITLHEAKYLMQDRKGSLTYEQAAGIVKILEPDWEI